MITTPPSWVSVNHGDFLIKMLKRGKKFKGFFDATEDCHIFLDPETLKVFFICDGDKKGSWIDPEHKKLVDGDDDK